MDGLDLGNSRINCLSERDEDNSLVCNITDKKSEKVIGKLTFAMDPNFIGLEMPDGWGISIVEFGRFFGSNIPER